MEPARSPWSGAGAGSRALPAGASTPVGRRVVLGMAALGAAGIVVGGGVQAALGRVLGSGIGAYLPGGDRFRIYTITGTFPAVSPEDYRLRVRGLVTRPLELSYQDLLSMPSTRLVRQFQCVTGWRVPGVHWEGVPLSVIVDRAGVAPGAAALALRSYDGADTESLTLAQARRLDVIAAYRMLGAPISREHGGPVRLYVAPMYGYKSLKWLSEIEVVDRVEPGFWEQNGYAVNAWIGPWYGRPDGPPA